MPLSAYFSHNDGRARWSIVPNHYLLSRAAGGRGRSKCRCVALLCTSSRQPSSPKMSFSHPRFGSKITIPPIIFARISPAPSHVVTQIRGDIPPPPTSVCTLYFYREKGSGLSSQVDPRRIELIHARRSRQFVSYEK